MSCSQARFEVFGAVSGAALTIAVRVLTLLILRF